MLKQDYTGIVDFHGVNWARIGGTNLSEMTGAKGVNVLVLEDVTGLQNVLDFRGIKALKLKNTDISKVRAIICDTNFNITDLKKQKWNGLFIFDYMGPLKPDAVLIRDLIDADKRRR